MNDQRNPNKKSRVFDDLRNSLFFSRVSISFEVNRKVSDWLDEIIEDLLDCLSDETRAEFTRDRLLELCLTALVEEYKRNKQNSLFFRVLCQSNESKSDYE
jgi:hypothetical protein